MTTRLLSYLQRLPGFSKSPTAAPEPCLQTLSSSLSELSRLMGSRCTEPAWLLCTHRTHIPHTAVHLWLTVKWQRGSAGTCSGHCLSLKHAC